MRVNIFELSEVNAFKREGTENKEAATKQAPRVFFGASYLQNNSSALTSSSTSSLLFPTCFETES